MASLCQAAACDYPATDLTNGNPVLTYSFDFQPKVKGTVQVDYMTQLTCPPYASYRWDALTGTNTLGVLQGTAVYVRITVTSADGSIPAASVIYFLKPPAAPLQIRPAAPTGFKVS